MRSDHRLQRFDLFISPLASALHAPLLARRAPDVSEHLPQQTLQAQVSERAASADRSADRLDMRHQGQRLAQDAARQVTRTAAERVAQRAAAEALRIDADVDQFEPRASRLPGMQLAMVDHDDVASRETLLVRHAMHAPPGDDVDDLHELVLMRPHRPAGWEAIVIEPHERLGEQRIVDQPGALDGAVRDRQRMEWCGGGHQRSCGGWRCGGTAGITFLHISRRRCFKMEYRRISVPWVVKIGVFGGESVV